MVVPARVRFAWRGAVGSAKMGPVEGAAGRCLSTVPGAIRMRVDGYGTVVLAACLTALATGKVPGGELRVERVFGREVPTGPYKHPACLAEFDNGDLFLV